MDPTSSNSMRSEMINAGVNGMYKLVGQGSIKASAAAERVLERDGRPGISPDELKSALKEDRVVLSLKNHDNAGHRYSAALEVSDAVSTKLDRADGREDGFIDLKKGPQGFFETLSAIFGNLKAGIMKSDLTRQLADGDLVLGREIRGRQNAKERDFTIVELHENKDGWKLTKGQ